MAIYGFFSVHILDVGESEENTKFVDNPFHLDKKHFETILDIQIDDNIYDYRIEAACLEKGGSRVHIFDINNPPDMEHKENMNEEHRRNLRIVSFKENVQLSNLKAKISKDFSNVIVGN